MSFQDQETSEPETALLLGDSQPASQPSWSLPRGGFGFSWETLLVPVVVASNLANVIPATTFFDLMRQTVCKISNSSRGDTATFLSDALSSPELCDTPEIERTFSTVIATLSAIEGIVAIAGCGILSRISSHYGRKPAFLFLLISGIMGNCLIPGAQHMPVRLADWVFLVGVLCEISSSGIVYTYLVNMYVVDVCSREDRTVTLSKIAGWGVLGTSIPYVLGGSITTKTGNPLIVFYIAAAIFVSTFIYVAFVLPESFPVEKRSGLSRMHGSPHRTARLTSSLHIFEPLKMLLPTRTSSGTRNWRLAWCALHTFVFMTATSYAPSAWMVLATTKYHFTPADTGVFLTIATASGAIGLTVVVPPLIRFLRPYYRRKSIPSPPTDEDPSDSDPSPLPETSDRLDVHLAYVSCVITAVGLLCAAASTTNLPLVISSIFVGFSGIHTPTIRSLVAGSVDPLKQGEALAAIEMVHSGATLLSPIIMGSILTATIDTAPLLMFYVHLVVVLVSAEPLFLVRDEDRYQRSNER